MNATDILNAAEKNLSMVCASDDALENALTIASCEIHRYAIQAEIDKRARWARKRRKGGTVNGMTKSHGSLTTRRCPTKRELR